MKWHAGIPVAMLHDEIAGELGVHIRERVSIKTSSRQINTIVDIVGSLIKKNEIAVSYELKQKLKLREGQKVDVNIAETSRSLTFIKKKLNNQTLSQEEIKEIIKDVVTNSISESEIAMFVSAVYKYGMTIKETIFLTKAILETGHRLNLRGKFVVDKHSIGGIPGRITPLVVSICAAAGLTMPKTSSRAITTPAGTADSIETLARVDFSIKELKKIVKKTRACMVWGGGLGMVPADSKIIKVEKLLEIDPKSNLIASIMSKKLAVGSKYILIHIPYGKSAKVDKKKALNLKTDFEKIGKYFKVKLKCVLTENHGPVGNRVGPALEMIDVIKVLKREDKCYQLEDKSVFLAGELLEMTGKVKKGKGEELAMKILDSGKAFEKFQQIIKAQGGNLNFKKLQPAKFQKDVHAKKSGKVKEVDNKKINTLARIAGCPVDKFAGLYIHSHVGDKVKKQDKILTIYSENRSRLNQAVAFYHSENPIKI